MTANEEQAGEGEQFPPDLAAALMGTSSPSTIFLIAGADPLLAVYAAWLLDGQDVDWRLVREEESLTAVLEELGDMRPLTLISSDPLVLLSADQPAFHRHICINGDTSLLPSAVEPVEFPEAFIILSSVPREFAQVCGRGIGTAWDRLRSEHDPEELILRRLQGES